MLIIIWTSPLRELWSHEPRKRFVTLFVLICISSDCFPVFFKRGIYIIPLLWKHIESCLELLSKAKKNSCNLCKVKVLTLPWCTNCHPQSSKAPAVSRGSRKKKHLRCLSSLVATKSRSYCWWFRNPKQPAFGCIKPRKLWDMYHINWWTPDFWTINRMKLTVLTCKLECWFRGSGFLLGGLTGLCSECQRCLFDQETHRLTSPACKDEIYTVQYQIWSNLSIKSTYMDTNP